jgi:hypothetical protein
VSHGPVVIPGVVVVVLLGAGTVIGGLTPPLPSSLAPSGIVPPLREVPAVPGMDSGEAVPLVETAPDDAQADANPAEPLAPVPAIPPVDPLLSPPPSKVDTVPIVDDAPAVPDSPAAGVDTPAGIVAQPVTGAGLTPPGLISVAPSGMPACDDGGVELMPDTPSGDVAPSAEPVLGVVGDMVICADAYPQPSTSITAVIIVIVRMTFSLFRGCGRAYMTRLQSRPSRPSRPRANQHGSKWWLAKLRQGRQQRAGHSPGELAQALPIRGNFPKPTDGAAPRPICARPRRLLVQ